MTESGSVFSVNTSPGGVPKLRVAAAMVTVNGLVFHAALPDNSGLVSRGEIFAAVAEGVSRMEPGLEPGLRPSDPGGVVREGDQAVLRVLP